MWTIGEVKEKGKLSFKANYWKCVIVAAILAALTAAQTSSIKKDSGEDISSLLSSGASSAGMSELAFGALVFGIIGVGLVIAILISIFIKNVLKVGCNEFFVANSTTEGKVGIDRIFTPFKENYKNVVTGMFMMDLYIFLWTLLLVIPGIVKSYEYRMVPYLLANDADMEWKEAFEKSKEMMYGNKLQAFLLDLSFIGWHILGAITLGVVSVLYTMPYVYSSNAELYLALLNKEN